MERKTKIILTILGILIILLSILYFIIDKNESNVNYFSSLKYKQISKDKGCDVKENMGWCESANVCINLTNTICRPVINIDSHGCKINENQKWCNSFAQCINSMQICPLP